MIKKYSKVIKKPDCRIPIDEGNFYLDNNIKEKDNDIKYYGKNNENVVDEKHELTSISISYPNLEENNNQHTTNNSLRIHDNNQIYKSGSDNDDSNGLDSKKSSTNSEKYIND